MKRGFTLLELVIVLGVITIVMGGIIVATRSNDNRDLYNALVVLQSDLRYIQRRSMMEGRPHDILFERQYNRYHIRIVGGGIGNPSSTIRTVYLPNGVTVLTITPLGVNDRLAFTARGTSSHGFTVTLTNGRYLQDIRGNVGAGGTIIYPKRPR